MTRIFLVLALPLVACGSADPCTAPTTGISLSSSSLAELGISETKLECAGTADGTALACSGATALTKVTCPDGFGVTVASGNVTLLVHFANTDHWSAGGQLASGGAATGNLTIAGLGADPHPPANATQAASFDLIVAKAKVNGTFTTTW